MLKFSFALWPPLSVLLLAVLSSGCGRDHSRSVEVTETVAPAKASVQLEKTFQAVSDPVIKQDAQTASVSLRQNDYEKAFVSLRKLQAQPGLTPEQDMAVRNALLGMQRQLAEAIVRGDRAALETAKRLQKTQ